MPCVLYMNKVTSFMTLNVTVPYFVLDVVVSSLRLRATDMWMTDDTDASTGWDNNARQCRMNQEVRLAM